MLERIKLITTNTMKRSVVARRSRWRMSRQSTEDFQDNYHHVGDTIITDTCHYALVQTHRMHNTMHTTDFS